jgi:hypothetical protein
VTFCEEVIKAGGGNWGSYSNCPAIATAETIPERMNSFYHRLECGLYELYGVPH